MIRWMLGLGAKAVREIWVVTLLFATALSVVMGLLTYILPQLLDGVNDALAEMPFVRVMISALLGIEVEGGLSAQLMQSILWVHPVVLALLWGHAMIVGTRVPAGEIDRGTADLLLGLPVTRWEIYLAESAVFVVAGGTLMLLGAFGHRATAHVIPAPLRPSLTHVAYVLLNLYAVYLVVGSVAFLASTLCDRRGRAAGMVFAFTLVSFLINFLVPLWQPAKRIAWLSFMHYYQPARILQEGEFPSYNFGVLCGMCAVVWFVGGLLFARRDICTT